MKRLPAAVTQRHWLDQMDRTEPKDGPGRRMLDVLAFNAPPPVAKR